MSYVQCAWLILDWKELYYWKMYQNKESLLKSENQPNKKIPGYLIAEMKFH